MLLRKKREHATTFFGILAILVLSALGMLLWVVIICAVLDRIVYKILCAFTGISGITWLLYKLFLYVFETEEQAIPKKFKPYITWEYDKKKWSDFKKQEFNIKIYDHYKFIIKFYLFFGCISGFFVFIFIDFYDAMKMLSFSGWILFLFFFISEIHASQNIFKEKKLQLNTLSPKVTMNSSGFTINNQYYPLKLRDNNKENLFLFEIRKKYGKMCLIYFYSKHSTYTMFEFGEGTHITTTEICIPIPDDKMNELEDYLVVIERNRNFKINKKY